MALNVAETEYRVALAAIARDLRANGGGTMQIDGSGRCILRVGDLFMENISIEDCAHKIAEGR